MTNAAKHAQTIRSDPEKLASIHEQLDARSSPKTNNQRASERSEYRHQKLVMIIQQPGDSAPMRYAVEPRDLGEGGLAFLYGGFIHTGSLCTAQLITLHGTWNDIPGTVVNCLYAADGLHEVHVKFYEPIEPALYCRRAIRSRVLLVEDDLAIARLAELFFTRNSADVDHAENGRVALAKAKDNMYDLILMDIEMPEMDGLTAVKKLRAKGYSGRIVAATSMTHPGARQKCLDAGFDDYIAKPLNRRGHCGRALGGATGTAVQQPRQ